MDRMSEEKFEAWVKEHADEYHRPPGDVPREEMWETIARGKAPQGNSPLVAGR
jgi:hypothetical protein